MTSVNIFSQIFPPPPNIKATSSDYICIVFKSAQGKVAKWDANGRGLHVSFAIATDIASYRARNMLNIKPQEQCFSS